MKIVILLVKKSQIIRNYRVPNNSQINNYNTSSYITNTDYYLYTPSYYYWTLTPWAFAGGDSRVDNVNDGGFLVESTVYVTPVAARAGLTIHAARPALSLNSDAITGGSGTMNDPFIVG